MNNASKHDADETLAGCGFAIASILCSPIYAIWRGYVVSILWRWFAVVAFDLRPLTIPAAIGLTYLVQLVTFVPIWAQKEDKSEAEKFVRSLMFAAIWPALALLSGWIVNHWM